ncbi:O-antigen ligase [Paenibacillus baekrokdamisoli]|nr:O-antigen ligase [Paenibacillus baekrokdamisoli]
MTKGLTVRNLNMETLTLALFIFCGPFFRGYIFESQLMWATLVISLGFIVFLLRRRLPQDITLYLLLALTAMYAASIGYGTDHREALDSLLKVAFLIPLYIFAQSVTRQWMNRIWMVWVWLTAMSVPLGVATDQFVDGRLAGFIDYANGYAILLLVGIIMTFALSVRGFSSSKWMQIPIFLCAVGICLTESRTVLALLFVAFVLLFFWSRRSFPLLWFRCSANVALGIAAATAYAWSPLLVIPVIVVFVLGYRLSDSMISHGYVRLILLAVVPLLVILALWSGSSMASRWSTLVSRTGEGFTRLVYYHDAWSMVLDSPVWGFGAGTWAYMQYHYQTAAYFTAYVHNQPLQVMIEIGIVGFLIFAAVCVSLVVRGFSAAKQKDEIEAKFDHFRMLACCILMMHSLVDFSLSFPYLLGLLFILGAPSDESASAANKVGRSVTVKTTAGIVTAGALIIATLLLVSDQLQQSATRAIGEKRKADAVLLLDRSASVAIFADRIHDRKARLYMREYESNQDPRYLDVARDENEKSLSGHSEQIWYRKLNSDILWMQGDRQKAVAVLSELVQQNRFMARWREELGQKEAQMKN